MFLVEGEKTADALLRQRVPATTYIKNSRNEARFFDGLNLVLCPDLDVPGIRAMESIAVQYPTAQWAYAYPDSPAWQSPPKSSGVDFADWIDEGATDEQILATIGPRRHPAPAEPKAKAQAKAEKTPTPKPSKVAAELRSKYAGILAFNSQTEQWVFYGHTKDGLWDTIPDAELEGVIQADLDAMAGFEDGYSMGYISSVIGLLRGRLNRFSWNEQPGLLPFTNGIYDLGTGKLSPHAPGYGFTWQLPRPYVAIEQGATLEQVCPVVADWLHEASRGNKSLIELLLCWLNAVLKGRSDLHKFIHLIGPGGTGKGTFLRLQSALIGENNIHSSVLSAMCQNNFEAANAYGKRLVVFSDEDKYGGGLGTFKKLTGGDDVRGENKSKTAFTFRYRGMVAVASNFPIFAGDTSSGMNRRVLTVPFTAQVPLSKRRNLEAEFETELAALTSYLLGMDDHHVTETLLGIAGQSPEVNELAWDMRLRTDSVAAWLNECVIHTQRIDTRGKLSGTHVGNDINDDLTLFGNYHQYCKRTGSIPKGLREFSPHLEDLTQHIIGWDDTAKVAGRTGKYFTCLFLRQPTDTAPGPIDKLIGICDGSRDECDGSVTDSVTAESIDIQGCDGCDGSEVVSEQKNETLPLNYDCNDDYLCGVDKVVGESSSDPSHPSQLDTARVSAVTAPVTNPSQHPSPIAPGCKVRWGTSLSPWLVVSIEGDQAQIRNHLNGFVRSAPLASLEEVAA